MEQQKRILRILEYVGTDKFIEASVDRRQIKGGFYTPQGYIREAILGETPEILAENRQVTDFTPNATTLYLEKMRRDNQQRRFVLNAVEGAYGKNR